MTLSTTPSDSPAVPPTPSWASVRQVQLTGYRPVPTHSTTSHPTTSHPTTSRPAGPPPGQRVGDTDRSRVCELLSLHYSEGRLEAEELEDRLSAAMAARTRADLLVLTGDLPTVAPSAGPVRGTPTVGGQTMRLVATLVLFGTVGICLLMILLALVVSPGWAVGAVFGGGFAAVGGIAIGYLWNTREGTPNR